MTTKCFDAMKEAAAGAFSDAEVNDMLTRLANQREAALSTGADLFEKLQDAKQQELDNEDTQTEISKLRTQEKIAIFNKKLEALSKFKHLKKRGLFVAMKSLVNGTERPIAGARLSSNAISHSEMLRFFGSFYKDIKNKDLMELFNSKEHSVELGRAMLGEDVGNAKIHELARIIRKHEQHNENLLRRRGVFIKKLEDRLTKTFHDKEKLLETADTVGERARIWKSGISKAEKDKLAFERWRKFVLPLLDHDRTFVFKNTDIPLLTQDEKDNFLREAFDTLTDKKNIGSTGPSSISARINKKRILHWKDAEAAVKYNEKYGLGNFHDAVIKEFQNAIRNIVMLKEWGNNPKAMMRALWAEAKDLSPNFKVATDADFNRVDNMMNGVFGLHDDVGGPWSAIGNAARTFENLTKLALVTLTSLTDLGPISAEMARVSGGFLKAFTDSLINLFEGKTKGEKKLIAQYLALDIEQQIGGMHRIFGDALDNPSKIIANTNRLMFKLNFLHWWDYKNKSGMAARLAYHLAQNKHISWDELDKRDQDIFSRYEIHKNEWDLIRKSPVKEGRRLYITPDAVRYIPDKEIRTYLRNQGIKKITQVRIDDARHDIESKLGVYFHDRLDHGILRPDVADASFVSFGTKKGSIWDQVARFINQYKLYGVSYITKPLANIIYKNGADTAYEALRSGNFDKQGLAQLIASTIFLGYVSLSAKALAKGISPPPVDSQETWFKAFLNSGAMGIYGDLLFNNYSSFKRGLLATVAGPVFDDLDTVASIASRSAIGIKKKISGDLQPGQQMLPTNAILHFVENGIPLNQIYTKHLLDYLIFNHLHNAITPDYWQKQNQLLQQNQQHYLFHG